MQAELSFGSQAIKKQNEAGSPMLRKLLRFNPEFELHRTGSQHRGEVEHHIAKVFAKTYNAEVTEFAPFLLSMTCGDSVSAAAGIRPAQNGSLFLEQYLDDPIEQVLSNRYGQAIDRHEIFELGNLAALLPGISQLLYLIMAGVVARTKLNYVVFAGTRRVAKGLGRLGFHMDSIAAADPARLEDGVANWGSYYDSEPQVMAIDLRRSMGVVSESPLPSILLNLYKPEIIRLANHFNSVNG